MDNMNIRNYWENYVYIPTQEELEEYFDDCLIELENIQLALKKHYNIDIKIEINKNIRGE